MQGLYVGYSSGAVVHTCAMWGHICSGTYVNHVKCMYTSAPGHIIDCVELLLAIYTDTVDLYVHMK